MKKALAYIFLLALPLVSCNKTGLKKGDWDGSNYKAIKAVVTEFGTLSEDYNPEEKPYAVFDFDNTTVTGDISLTLMAYQIENLRYSIDPEDIYTLLLAGLPSIDCALDGFDGVSARMLATDLQNDYIWLCKNYISSPASEEQLKTIRKSDEYLDFRAKLWSLSLGIDNTFGYGISCPWILRLFSGMSEEQLKDLTREAALSDMKRKKLSEETWTSPDMGEAGSVSVSVPRGLAIRKELVNLYKSLADNGFDTYIISASGEAVVEAVACDGTMDLNLDPANVFGMCFYEGKSEQIRKALMPQHGGKGPAIVAGDSNGDYNMLTDFDDMALGIVFDLPRSGAIEDLKKDNSGRYIVQKW